MVEGARLESVYAGNRIAGSNPAPSASSAAKTDEFGVCSRRRSRATLPPLDNGGWDFGKTLGVRRTFLQKTGGKVIQLFHRNCPLSDDR